MTTGTDVCGGSESRSRLTDKASCESTIAGKVIKQTMAIAVSIAIGSGFVQRTQLAQKET
jgi:hypothetical protein